MKYPITSNFGAKESFRKSTHNGIDFAFPKDSPLYSISDGVVSKIIKEESGSSLGNAVFIKLKNGNELVYAHLNKININVGDKIYVNQLIGYSGNTGNVVGDNGGYHLHFAVKDTNGNWVNPEQYIPLIQKMGNIEIANDIQTLDPSAMLYQALNSFTELTVNTMNLINNPILIKYFQNFF